MFGLSAVFDIVGYATARALLPVLTLGCARADDLTSSKPGGWLGYYRDSDRRIVFTAAMAGWIGVFVWLLLAVALIVATGR